MAENPRNEACCGNPSPQPNWDDRFRRFVIFITLCGVVLAGFLVCMSPCLQSLRDGMAAKTFWRTDRGVVVQYHIRDYRVPWSEQLLAAIAFARKHGEHLYLEDTQATDFARNRGNLKTVGLSEAEQAALERVSGFLAEHCALDVQHGDADATMRVFPTTAVATEAKRLFDDVLAEHPKLFYVHYLLGVWYREQGDKSASAVFDFAFDIADCVVICPVMMLDEHSGKVVPIKNTRFSCGVTTKHRTEQWNDVTLWYPAVETDQHGLVRLPVYREMIADPAFEAVDANGTRFVVQTFGLRDIANPYRFGLYVPVVLSGGQCSQLTCSPGLEEELRYAKRQVFAGLSLDDAPALGELGIVFQNPRQFQIEEGGVIMPALRYADEFAGLHFRGLTRTELTRKIRQYRSEHINPNRQPVPTLTLLTVTDGDHFIASRSNGRTYLCRYFASDIPQQTGTLDVWDLGWVLPYGL